MSKFPILRAGLTLSAGIAFSVALVAQTSQSVVKDINTNPSTSLTNSYPYPARSTAPISEQYKWAQMGGFAYFQATTAATGYELFKSDGKTTTMVADIWKGSSSGNPYNITPVGTNIFFSASDGTNGTELWISDGTAAGTKMVKDIYPGSSSSSPSYLAEVAGKVVFRANDGTNGTELWISDGTAAGTKLLMDIYPGSSSGSPSYIQSNFAMTMAFFYANDGKTGSELWVTNGTPAGTMLVKDIYSGTSSSSPRYFLHLGATKVVFQANDGVNGQELWVSDGTAAGTSLVADIYTGSSGYTYTQYGVSLGTKCVFRSRDTTTGYEAWVTDGTKAGTMLLKDIYSGTSSGYLYYPCVEGSLCYYGATDGSGYQIYVTDGTPAGTKLFGPATFSTSSPSYLHAMGGKVYCSAYNVTASTGYEICVNDGTTAKTFQDTYPGTSSGYGYYIGEVAKGILGFASSDGVAGREFWVTDGTAAGTKMFDINPPIAGATADDGVSYITSLFGKMIFRANDGSTGYEIWISDGTAAGTKLLKDIYPGSSSSSPSYCCQFGNYVYFSANDGTNGYELWRTDGTAAGTTLFVDIYAGSSSSYPYYMHVVGDKMYFRANNGTTGYELWVSDGTKAGTVLVKDIYPGSSSSSPNYFARLGLTNKVLFQAYDGTSTTGTGNELWISDGTAAGTKLVKDIYASGTSGSYPAYLTPLGDKVYFHANDGTNGYELWVTDGTSAGTTLVKDIYTGSSSGYAYYLCAQDGKLFFRSYTSATGYEMFTSDGTTAGTGLYLDYNAGTGNTYSYYMTAVGSRRVYFRGEDPTTGADLMYTDVTVKTPAFTVFDLNPAGSSSPNNYANGRYGFAVDGGSLWFYATKTSSPTDYQLWRGVNGATAQSIGSAIHTSAMTSTDPLIGQNITIAGLTGVTNPLSVLCLGVPDSNPQSLGTFVPGAYAYFQLTNYFWIVGNLPGKAWGSVFPVPNDPTLLGDSAVLQTFALDSLTFPANTEVTNGVHLTMGK